MNTSLIIIALVVIAIIAYFFYKRNAKTRNVYHLPLRLFGLKDVPAIPIILDEIPKTLFKLNDREHEMEQALNGLSHKYTIGEFTEIGKTFMFGRTHLKTDINARDHFSNTVEKSTLEKMTNKAYLEKRFSQKDSGYKDPKRDPVTRLSLEDANQFEMSWTTFDGVHKRSKQYLEYWSQSITDPDVASAHFWPTIATYGLAYNLLFLESIDSSSLSKLQNEMPIDIPEIDQAAKENRLYGIDLRVFKIFKATQLDGDIRYTPPCYIFLTQDPATKALDPRVVYIRKEESDQYQSYYRPSCSDASWIYALQAAKTAATVYGIWIGHVYHWHIVPATLQMTMFNTIPKDHLIYKLLAPQSNYLIGFDDVLLMLWKHTAPPTSLVTSKMFLELINTHAKDRKYHDDDPIRTLERNGITKENFSAHEDWDQYPIVGQLLRLWEMTEIYVDNFVENAFESDEAIDKDIILQKWINNSTSSNYGNLKGIGDINSKKSLKAFLTSLLYRITAHGISRLNEAANPGLTFVPNFPPTLHSDNLPTPGEDWPVSDILKYLPNTGTLGEVIKFYYTFVFSAPYEPFIPTDGEDEYLFFEGGKSAPLNIGLIAYRHAMRDFISDFCDEEPQIYQWPLNVET
ncbi:MAG: hypothetical protein HKN09_02740 [Saprospiraceae bacterium]|nr:hypothetical protein [Saprospiraceae bacterium]